MTGWVLPLEGEDGDDCDYGEGECAEVADGGCQGLGYGQLEVGGERGDAMGNVEEGRGEQDDEEQLGDGIAEEREDVVVGDGVGQPSQGAGDVVGEDEGGQCEGGDGAADAEERPPHRFQLLHRLFPRLQASEGENDDGGDDDPGGESPGEDGALRDTYAEDELRHGPGHQHQDPGCGVEDCAQKEDDVEGYP